MFRCRQCRTELKRRMNHKHVSEGGCQECEAVTLTSVINAARRYLYYNPYDSLKNIIQVAFFPAQSKLAIILSMTFHQSSSIERKSRTRRRKRTDFINLRSFKNLT